MLKASFQHCPSSLRFHLLDLHKLYVTLIEDGKKFSQSGKYDVLTIDFVYEKSSFRKKLKGTWETIGKNGEDLIMPEVIIDYIDNYPSDRINASDFSC